MKKQFILKACIQTVAVFCIALGLSFSAFARTEIATVDLWFRDLDIIVGSSANTLEFEDNAVGYTVAGRPTATNFTSGGWKAGVAPTFSVTLNADSGYKFKEAKIEDPAYYTLATESGNPVHFVKASGSSNSVTLTFRFDKLFLDLLAMTPGEPEWGDNGTAKWISADTAKEYEVQIFRNSGVTPLGTVKTSATTANMAKYITSAGTYYFRVKGSNEGNSSDWAISGGLIVAESDLPRYAEAAKAGGTSSQPTTPSVTSGTWLKDHVGWWFKNPDNSYPANAWKLINGSWYFFNGSGYMESNKWVESAGKWYYVGGNGAMLSNTTTPDGYKVGPDGAWIP